MFDEMKRFQREMNRLFASMDPHAGDQHGSSLPSVRRPLVDLKETDTHVIATIELPGIEKKEIKLDVMDTRLELGVERKQSVAVEKQNYHVKERSYERFYRTLKLPHPVVPAKTKATYTNGILEVVMTKGERQEKPPVFIE